MSNKKTIGFECFTTMLDIIDANGGFNCQSGPNCEHDKYRQAAQMLSYTDRNTSTKLFDTLFNDTKLDCDMHNPKSKRENNTYKNDYTFYKLHQEKS